jgi:hypothetical protein
LLVGMQCVFNEEQYRVLKLKNQNQVELQKIGENNKVTVGIKQIGFIENYGVSIYNVNRMPKSLISES